MNLRAADYYLVRLARAMPRALKLLGDLETDILRSRLDDIEVDRPVFITGLARSGTTTLLNIFSSLPHVGTHRYRDFPFLFVPYCWNRFQSRMAPAQEPVERPHKDRIRITRDSPEAFEEPIWTHFFPFVHESKARHVLTASDENAQFDTFYMEHLRKLLLLRAAQRYVSKGNYNVARLEYLARLLPDARFVVPVRHPLSHVNSLVRQHKLFTHYSEEDERVPEYLRAAGHYEFGPQRVPINLDEESPPRILEAWAEGHDDLGYAVMWRSVYAHVQELVRGDHVMRERIRIVRYEDFCSDPAAELAGLFDFCELVEGVDHLLSALPEISAPKSNLDHLTEAHRERIWHETAELAATFGYKRDLVCRRSGTDGNGRGAHAVRVSSLEHGNR
jgi:Sulfotransferase family